MRSLAALPALVLCSFAVAADTDWAGWRNRTDRLFGTLFPPPPKTADVASR